MRPLSRVHDWPDRLDQVIAEHQAAPFVWGHYDCATLWTSAVHAMTGVDLTHDFPRWRNELGAMRALRSRGFDSVADYVAAVLPTVPASLAGRGDLGFPEDAWRGPLASPAVLMGQFGVSRDDTRWIIIPRQRLVTFFKV